MSSLLIYWEEIGDMNYPSRYDELDLVYKLPIAAWVTIKEFWVSSYPNAIDKDHL